MTGITATVELIRAFGRVYAKKWSFLAAFLAVFFVSFSTLATLDLVPDAPGAKDETAVATTTPDTSLTASVAQAITVPENVTRVTASKIGLDVTVSNPVTTDVEVLDNALLSGALRYPTSAKLGQEGNVILFGHSSYLPVVHNKAFKAFDGIQDLKAGDRITVYSSDRAYVYAVTKVVQTNTDGAIPLTKTGHTLTLATCDSFGKKTDRFVVTAELVETSPLTS